MINQLSLEIKIHKDLRHKNIVSLYGIFDDTQNVYLVL
jgi:serine/threonine protein kinase